MSVLVKICGITNWEDAHASIEAGAGALGFNFYPESPRYLSPAAAAEIARLIPAGILKVGVFVNASPEEVCAVRAQVGLDVVQLHGDEDPAAYHSCGSLWRAVQVRQDFDAAELPAWPVEALLLDGPAGTLYGGAGVTFDWAAARGLPQRIVVAGGLTPENVADAIRIAQPWGVDACSRLETSPGIKDHERIRAFVQAVRRAESAG